MVSNLTHNVNTKLCATVAIPPDYCTSLLFFSFFTVFLETDSSEAEDLEVPVNVKRKITKKLYLVDYDV